MFFKRKLPAALSESEISLWLNARLWPDGPPSPLRGVLAICGAPRSGTTWLHNILIHSGRFKGIPADDQEDVGPDPFLTDENRFIHLSLMQGFLPNADPQLSRLAFLGICNLIYLRFGVSGELMLKSPYYSYFANAMFATGLCNKFIFMRRNLDFVALSMLEHSHIGLLLKNKYESSYDVISGSTNIEARYIDKSLLCYVLNRYDQLSLYERGLFKALCFSSSFVNNVRHVQPGNIFIFNYETFQNDHEQRSKFRKFVSLTDDQWRKIEASFRPRTAARPSLPPHDPAFRSVILETESSLW